MFCLSFSRVLRRQLIRILRMIHFCASCCWRNSSLCFLLTFSFFVFFLFWLFLWLFFRFNVFWSLRINSSCFSSSTVYIPWKIKIRLFFGILLEDLLNNKNFLLFNDLSKKMLLRLFFVSKVLTFRLVSTSSNWFSWTCFRFVYLSNFWTFVFSFNFGPDPMKILLRNLRDSWWRILENHLLKRFSNFSVYSNNTHLIFTIDGLFLTLTDSLAVYEHSSWISTHWSLVRTRSFAFCQNIVWLNSF